jgi:hypothetical protein
MAFKLRSPLHNKPELPVANDGSDKFKNYQANLKKTYMSSKDSGVGAYPDPQTGERTFYDKKHQSYDRKKGVTNKTGSFKGGEYVMNKPKPAAKPKSPYPANQGGSPLDYRGDGKFNSDKTNITGADLLGQGPVAKGFRAITGIDVPKSSFPSKKTSTTGPSTGSKGGLAGGGKGESMQEQNKPASSVSNTNTKTNTKTNTGTGTGTNKFEGMAPAAKPKNTNPKKTNTSTNTSTSNTTNNTKPIKSSDSDKGTGYFNDKLSLGVDTKLNVAPMPKFEKTVTNARSADYDMIKAKGRGRTSKLKSRLDDSKDKVLSMLVK